MYTRFTSLLGLLSLVVSAAAQAATPQIEHWETDRGARVYFVAADELPMIDVRLVFDAGSARDGDKGGLAGLTTSLLNHGADGLSADEISEAFESLGARYGSSMDRDSAGVSLRTLTDPEVLKPSLETLRQVVSKPDFPATDFERERQRMLIGIRSKKQSPGALAADALYENVYGDHPYARPSSGTEDSVAALTRDDLVEFHRRHFTETNAVVAIVGAVDRDQAEQIAAGLLRDLPQGEPMSELPPAEPGTGGKIKIGFPSAQTHVLLGYPVLSRHDPDFFPLYIGNHVLGGGGMVSRLFESVRERRGLSYSVYSYFLPMRAPGPFVAGLQTNTAQASAALEVLREEIRSFIETGPTEEELDASKKNITGGFPLRIDSNSSIVGYLAMIGTYKLPLDYLETFTEKVEAVTVEDIRDAFQRRLNPDAFVTVLVGRHGDD